MAKYSQVIYNLTTIISLMILFVKSIDKLWQSKSKIKNIFNLLKNTVQLIL